MRVGLSTLTFDLDGHVEIDAMESSDVDSIERRITRVKTLDGGVSVRDGGYADGDRTVAISWLIRDAKQFDAVQYLVKHYSQLRLSMRSGCYLCAPRRLSRSGTEGRLDILLIERQSI